MKIQADSVESATDSNPTHAPQRNVAMIAARKKVGNWVPTTNGLIARRSSVAAATRPTVIKDAVGKLGRRHDRPPPVTSSRGTGASHAPRLAYLAKVQCAPSEALSVMPVLP